MSIDAQRSEIQHFRYFRWQRRAENPIQQKSQGKYLDNNQKHRIRRLQRCQAQQSTVALSPGSNDFTQEFHLIRISSYHGIPKASFKRLFELWKSEQSVVALSLGSNDADGGAA